MRALQGLSPDASAKKRLAEPSGGASGQASDIAIHAREILRVREALTRIYQRHCGQPGESVEDGMQRFGASRPFPFVSVTAMLTSRNQQRRRSSATTS